MSSFKQYLYLAYLLILTVGFSLSGAEDSKPNKLDQDAADLAKVTAFVRKQLKKTAIVENPDVIEVAFASEPIKTGDGYAVNQCYDKKTYAIIKSTIQVPRRLVAVLQDKNDNQSFEDDERFVAWFNAHIGFTHNKPAHLALYQRSINVINKEELYNTKVEGNIAKARSLINAQRLENYRRAKAVIDHEATHIKKNHLSRKLLFNQNVGFLTSGLALVGCGLVMGNKAFWSQPTPASLITPPIIMGSSFGVYYLLKQSFSRACELEADDGIRPKPSVLRANAEYFRYSQSVSTKLPYRYAIANLLASHPLDSRRALRMKQRADALEKKC